MKEILWDNIKNGDKASFKALFDQYYYPLCQFSSSITNNYPVAEDIVVECFVKLWENRENVKITSSLKNYLLTVIKNSTISYLRKEKKTTVDLETISFSLSAVENENVDQAELYNELYKVINKLPESRRRILKMASFEGKTYPEIAAELNISVNTVKTQISRAYKFIKSELDSNKAPIYMVLLF